MSDAALLQLLAVVCQQLDAAYARVEIGGPAPEGPHVLWAELVEGRRVVVVFDEPPRDAARALRRLEALVASFTTTLRPPSEPAPRPTAAQTAQDLAGAMRRLAVQADAVQAVVIDRTSPVRWASSHVEPAVDADAAELDRVSAALEGAERQGIDVPSLLARSPAGYAATPAVRNRQLDGALARLMAELRRQSPTATVADWQRHGSTTRALAACRQRMASQGAASPAVRLVMRSDHVGFVARGFASIYLVVLVFSGRFSELRAERALALDLRGIERLVLSLPPFDPLPPGGRVVRLRR